MGEDRTGSRRPRGARLALLTVVGLVASLVAQVAFLAVAPSASAARLVANAGAFSIRANGGAAKIGNQIFEFEGADAQDVQFTGTVASDGTIFVPGSR